ncbi:MAG: ABC transporter permease [Candidatus Merdivicinus sp.]
MAEHTISHSVPETGPARTRQRAQAFARLRRNILRNWQLYILILPATAYFLFFCYGPMYGVQIAFKDFIPTKGITGSPWVGFKHFETLFHTYSFGNIFKNTISLSLYSLAAGFPIPIILALLLNEVDNKFFKKLVQNVTYAPHFISVVVLVGMLNVFMSPTGVINAIVRAFGGETQLFLANSALFNDLYVWSGVWQGMGWSSIIYLAALSGLDMEVHEAARVDGATRLQRMWYINLPTLVPTIVILLVLDSGRIMNVGFEKVFLMQNNLNLDTAEVISTYVYKIGLVRAQYSFSAAVGLFNNIINLVLILLVNTISNKISGTGLW